MNEVFNPTDQLIAYFTEWRRFCFGKKQKDMNAGHPKNQRMAYSLRGSRVTATPKSLVLTLDDLFGAEKAIVRYCQQRKFREDISENLGHGGRCPWLGGNFGLLTLTWLSGRSFLDVAFVDITKEEQLNIRWQIFQRRGSFLIYCYLPTLE